MSLFGWLRQKTAVPGKKVQETPAQRPGAVRPGPAPVRPPIAIVTAYFGKLPMYAPAFFESCRGNPDVQYFLYCDFDVPGSVPQNVHVRRMETVEFNQRATEVVGTPIEVRHHLAKVNDFKPVYGLMFEEDLKGFPYWAYSDFDVAWGSIRTFVTDELLHAHDLISARSDRLCGHFTLFRNTPEHNRMWEIIPDVVAALGCPTHMHLDEKVFTKYVKDGLGQWPLTFKSRVYWKSEWTVDAKYQRAMGDGPADLLWWREGRTFDVEGQERMYLHFHKLKGHMQGINFKTGDAPAAFSISRRGIFA